jgi:hypothetical protein
MKRWAILTVALYLFVLAALTVPVILLAFGQWWGKKGGTDFGSALEAYQELGFWIWLAVMGLGQALLLLAPVGIAERKPTPRRPLLVPVVTVGFFMAALVFGGLLALLCAFFKDNGMDAFALIGQFEENPLGVFIVKNAGASGNPSLHYIFGMITVTALLWLIWALVFYRFARIDRPNAFVKRTTGWLLRGSILELLVAVPSHIIVRHRDDCCAPLGTFWGITTGLSVMLLCFGPGVFFLFAERLGRLQPAEQRSP